MEKKGFLITLVFLALLLVSNSCKNNEAILPSDYIKFETDNNSYLLTKATDGIWNTYFKSDNQDELGLVMEDENGEFLVQIYLLSSDFLNEDLPYIVDKEFNQTTNGFAEMSLINLKKHPNNIFSETDSINYLNHSADNFYLTISSFENNILSGKFHGVLKTKTGKEMTVKNGQYKIKIRIEGNKIEK